MAGDFTNVLLSRQDPTGKILDDLLYILNHVSTIIDLLIEIES